MIAQASTFASLTRQARPVLRQRAAGFVVVSRGRPFAVAGFTIAGERIVEIDILADPDRLSALKL